MAACTADREFLMAKKAPLLRGVEEGADLSLTNHELVLTGGATKLQTRPLFKLRFDV